MIAKVVFFCAAFAAVNAAALLSAPIISTGVSTSSRQQDALGNYAFGYDIANGVGATNSRAEVGDALGNKKGAYTITDIDGRARRVDYVADALGFRASVKTNEPGTALSAPAAAMIASPYAPPVAPIAPAVAAAPVLAAPAIAAAAPVAAYSSVIGHNAAIGIPTGLGLWGTGISKSILL
ncbi:Adult-specific rigid cuticular protein 15.7, partial [Stegodyphus mimosarum]